MSRAATRKRMLEVVRTDHTFERTTFREHEVWAGKCLHCNATLLLGLDGTPVSRVTLEHIVPKTAGGSDALENLGLACARCNHGKGKRHDRFYDRSPRAQEVTTRLLQRRKERWRDDSD